MTEPEGTPEAKQPSILLSLIPVVVLIGLLALNVRIFKSGDNQVSLILATAVAAVVARFGLGRSWEDLEKGMLQAIGQAMQAVLILMVIGMLVAAWIKAGIVPILISYGLKTISPSVFLLTSCLVCCVIALATGSSWMTAGSVGVALMGIGRTMGFDPGMVAGAIVSGSYFGDKMSPLSDTTNLAPAMAGATLFEHVKHMVWTVTPALVISLGLYLFLGGEHSPGPDAMTRIDATVKLLEANFASSPLLLLPPLLVIALIIKKFPAVPALLFGTISAVVIGLAAPPPGAALAAEAARAAAISEAGTTALDRLAELQLYWKPCADYFAALFSGYTLELPVKAPAGVLPEAAAAAVESVTSLLDGKGGMKSMMGTVAIVFCAMSFGGVMERSGMLASLANGLLSFVRGTGSLVLVTISTCIGINVLASDQYMAIVVPGRMYRTAFLRRGLHPKNLSRCLEDAGTLTSPLVPWNTCGAQMTAVLGVLTWSYAPYAFLCYLCPVVSVVYGFTGFSMERITDEEAERRIAE